MVKGMSGSSDGNIRMLGAMMVPGFGTGGCMKEGSRRVYLGRCASGVAGLLLIEGAHYTDSSYPITFLCLLSKRPCVLGDLETTLQWHSTLEVAFLQQNRCVERWE